MTITKRIGWALASFAFALICSAAQAQLADKKVLTLEAAKKIASGAEAEAKRNSWTVVIAVVDDGGNLIYLQRIDGTQIGSIDVAIKKAKTAAAFKRPTKVFEDAIAGGRTAILGLDAALPLEGGLPLITGGQVVGAIGVSGATSQQDGQVAKAGADAFGSMCSSGAGGNC
ncbi:MAG TPA: heme-binding protein [Burkholderiales bacterium]|nr:heme-binding protein [Burkholderiales bacterium]